LFVPLGFLKTFLECSVDAEGDPITYSLEASLENSTIAQDTTDISIDIVNDTSGTVLDIAFFCATAACGNAARDDHIYSIMVNTLGHTVTNFTDADEAGFDAGSYDLIVASESIGSSNTNWMKEKGAPIITVEGAQFDELDLGTGGGSLSATDNTIDITDNTHYITATYPTGVITVTTDNSGLGEMNGWANDVQKLAHYVNDVTGAKLLAIENGGTLANASATAAERRAFFGQQDTIDFNSNGDDIFIRALNWAAYLDTEKNTTSTQYNDIIGDIDLVNELAVTVEVDSYDASGSQLL